MEIKKFESEVKSVFSMICDLNSSYDATAENSLPQTTKLSGKIFHWIALGPLIIGFTIVGGLWLYEMVPNIGFAALVLISFGYLGMIAFQVSLLIENRQQIGLFFKNPLSTILQRVERETILDYTKMFSALESEIDVLRHVRRHLMIERESFERRIGVLVGALEKVGLIPGFITLYLAWAKFSEQSLSIDPWIAVSVFVLYFFAFYFHYLFSRMDRYIGTLDEIIEVKEST